MTSQNLDIAVNIGSLIGTWLGTLFTGVGLLAVLTQLRSLLRNVLIEKRRWKEEAAGGWADCILTEQLPSNGVSEGVLPVFSGWLQAFYLEGKSITVSQDDRGAAGKSSWSNLFSRLNIEAVDLNNYGGVARRPRPTQIHGKGYLRSLVRPLRPGLADTLVENRSVSYGFSAAEFAALIILGGFHPKDFVLGKTCSSTSWFGKMLVAEFGQFSQVARFDPHHGFRDQIQTFRTDMHTFSVAQCMNLALGIIHIRGRYGREWIILPELPDHERTRDIWNKYPQSHQLRKIKYSFNRFVGVTNDFNSDYSHRIETNIAKDAEVLYDILNTAEKPFVPQERPTFAVKARMTLDVAHAIAAIVPWGVHPIIPPHLASALSMVLEPFYRAREKTIQVLQHRLKEIPNEVARPGGWNGTNLIAFLDNVAGDKDRFFIDSGGSYAFIYYEGMSLVFQHNGIRMEVVRLTLAAAVAVNLPELKEVLRTQEKSVESECLRHRMTRYLESCYLDPVPASTLSSVPDWALDVYGTYPRDRGVKCFGSNIRPEAKPFGNLRCADYESLLSELSFWLGFGIHPSGYGSNRSL